MKTIFLIIVVYFIFGVQPSNHQKLTESQPQEINLQTIDDTMVYSAPLLETRNFTKTEKACIDDTCFTQLITNDLVEIKNSLIELNKELENY